MARADLAPCAPTRPGALESRGLLRRIQQSIDTALDPAWPRGELVDPADHDLLIEIRTKVDSLVALTARVASLEDHKTHTPGRYVTAEGPIILNLLERLHVLEGDVAIALKAVPTIGEHSDRLETLERWRWFLAGAAAAIAVVWAVFRFVFPFLWTR